jgi:hypothetical protein
MHAETNSVLDHKNVKPEMLKDLTRRVEDIATSYRSIAEKMGQLYVCTDENKVASPTPRPRQADAQCIGK